MKIVVQYFLPKHPVINPDIDKAVLYEKSFDYESLINAAIENEEVIKISNKKKKILIFK